MFIIKKPTLFLLLFLSINAFPQKAEVDIRVRTALDHSQKAMVLVKLRAQTLSRSDTENLKQQILQLQNGVLSTLGTQEFRLGYQYKTIPGFSGALSENGLYKLENNPEVESIQPDMSGHAGLLESVPVIEADKAHDLGFTGKNVIVGVLDSGVNSNHPDLSEDIIYQYHFLDQGADVDTGAFDLQGHGSNVTGIVTSDGHIAPTGVAPDAKIVAIQVLDANGAGWVSDWIAGVDYIIHNNGMLNVRIINMSLVSNALYTDSDCDSRLGLFAAAVHTAKNIGIVVFACSGNWGSLNGMNAPACLSDVIAVGAVYDSDLGREPNSGTYYSQFGGYWPDKFDSTTSAGTLTCFTNRNANLDLVAPGARITSTGLGNGTSTFRGTSQASPHAAGVAALMLQKKPSLTPAEILTILKSGSNRIYDPETGFDFPLINAMEALEAIKETDDHKSISLQQNYPNPFNEKTEIPFEIPENSFVSLTVYNMIGEEVAILFSDYLTADTYSIEWNANGFSSGLYFYRLKTGSFIETKKMILLR